MRVLCATLLGLAVVHAAENETMNALAERYVKLVLALGQHDADYVDAYYGPPEWKKEAEQAKRPLAQINRDAAAVYAALVNVKPEAQAEETVRLRHEYLTRQLSALRARVSMLEGKRFSFDEESKALYDAVAPTHSESEFEAVLAELESRLPGTGSLSERLDRFRSQFVIPKRTSGLDVQGRDRCVPQPDARAPVASSRGELHRRVRHEQELVGLQLVPRQLSQPHPGQHRSPDFRRPGHRPRVPRGISRPSRLQRAAREDAGSRPRLGRVLGVPAAIATVAHRRGIGQLRHRHRVPSRRAGATRADGDLPGCWSRSSRGRDATTRCWLSPIDCRTPATKPRDGI